ncbi:ribonuclease Z [Nematocida major]|uniref:ribonuclease Z n=1 Tax=Nematocida major TaxID=1912982 RepID=UPI00200783B5|nr:ribonuclease Z [Nematocida major]KAH9386208.1 ribonuclease Z [Nematocida major]
MYRVCIHTTESGSAVRIVNAKTAEYILIGGFEGMQRYTSRNKIKWQKLSVMCITSNYEVIPAISAVLTHGIHDQQHTATCICTASAQKAASVVGLSIGNLEFFEPHAGQQGAFWHIRTKETAKAVYTEVQLSPKVGGFDVQKAAAHGILSKADIMQINKTGSVCIDGVTHYLEKMRKPCTSYPKILVITLLCKCVNPEEIRAALGPARSSVDIIIRAAPEAYKDKKAEHFALSKAENAAKAAARAYAKGTPHHVNVYVVMCTETECDRVKDFYDRVCPEYKGIVRPVVYSPKFTRFFHRSTVLTDRSEIEYSKEDRTVHAPWKRDERASGSVSFIKASREGQEESSLLCEDVLYTVFLGTAAAVPGVIRNVSSIMMCSQRGAILLDCGEDTHTQLSKMCANYTYNYSDIKAMVLSHRHADHILGAFSVLKRCQERKNKTVVLLGHKEMVPALRYFGLSCIFVQNSVDIRVRIHVEDSNEHIFVEKAGVRVYIYVKKTVEWGETCINPLQYRLSSKDKVYSAAVHSTFLDAPFIEFVNVDVQENKQERLQIGELLYTVYMCNALHIHDSYSVRVDARSESAPYSVTYSGDTLPNRKFSDLSWGANLMIHEGTFEEEEAENAKFTHHSTTADAVKVFKDARAKKLYLTHFSQRYKTIEIPEEGFLAMDYMVHAPGLEFPQQPLFKALEEWANEE